MKNHNRKIHLIVSTSSNKLKQHVSESQFRLSPVENEVQSIELARCCHSCSLILQ